VKGSRYHATIRRASVMHQWVNSTMKRLQSIEILHVDDNPGDIELFRVQFGGVVHAVVDGVQAMQFLQKKGEYAGVRTPDLVILDINVPKKNGHEVLEEIRADDELRYIPVIIFTTSDRDKDIERAYAGNVNAYVTKPERVTDFMTTVGRLANFWLSHVRFVK
jgi:two-component system, chemotaxis family, response regulator Rcp1